jgi:alpha-mannosidase
MASPTTVHLVPHTHWDREWYLPFQLFRMRLVGLLDGLLDAMEADPRLRFTLDGQLVTVDDYLEIRPQSTDRVARLVGSGRLAVGPWFVLMDEFLVSGETIVRNLELGTRRAGELGRVMNVGYLPDMFGHVAQMPQILRRAGIADAVVWRGVPDAIRRHVFRWVAPDGSAVRTEYLWRGYGNARDVFDDPARIAVKLAAYAASVAPLFGTDEILAMYGEDHSIPLQGYADLVERFNAAQDRFHVQVDTLAEYLEAAGGPDSTDPSWTGELRSSGRANILMGVISNHVDVRQAAGRAERLLERTAEPLLALHGTDWPARFLELAARRIVENSAHDSICACSLDDVVDQVLVRFAEAEQIATGLAATTLGAWAGTLPRGAWAVFNPTPAPRADLVEVDLAGDGPDGSAHLVDAAGRPIPVQELDRTTRTFDDRSVAAADVATYLRRRIHGRELYTRQVNGWSLGGPDGRELTIRVDPVLDPPVLDVDGLLAEIETAAGGDPGGRWRVLVVEGPRRRLLARVSVEPLGLASVGPAVGPVGPAGAAGAGAAGAGAADRPDGGPPPVRVARTTLDNGLLRVAIDRDGSLSLAGAGVRLNGAGRLVDGGDAGDTYNYAPPTTDTRVEIPNHVTTRMLESGPLRGIAEVSRRYDWPAGLSGDLTARRHDTVAVDVVTTVELRAGEPFVRLALAFDNAVVDHRLRFHVPLPQPVAHSFAEGQFAIVERGLTAEAGHGEMPLPTYPAHAFVAAGGAAVLARHAVEYELVEKGSELAITIVRATGVISRDDHPYRDEPAGPMIATPGAQLRGPRTFELALMPYGTAAPGSEVLAAAEVYRHPFLVGPGTGPQAQPLAGRPGLAIEGDGVVLSALRRRGAALEVRLVAERPSPVRARIRGPFTGAREADLLGRPGAPLRVRDGVLDIELGPWEIRTLWLEPPD